MCLLETVWTCQVMLGVDRLDMIKGIPQKILAFEKFLEENSTWHEKVVLLQIAVPTRTDVPECMLFPHLVCLVSKYGALKMFMYKSHV